MTEDIKDTVILNIGCLVTCSSSKGDPLGIVEGATIHARNGRIMYAGPEKEAPALPAGAQVTDAEKGTVTPGFVDAHTHLAWGGTRADEYEALAKGVSYAKIAADGGGIRSTVAATSAALESPESLLTAMRMRLRDALGWGTTTVEIKSGYGATPEEELRLLELIATANDSPGLPGVVATYLPLHSPPGTDAKEVIEQVIESGIPSAARVARFIDVFCDEYAWPSSLCEPVLSAARAVGIRRKLHADQLSCCGGAQLAARTGATSADHLDLVDEAGIRELSVHAVTAVLTPATSLTLGSKPAPAASLIEAGVPIAIATDRNPGTCNCSSMPLVMSLGVALYRIPPHVVLLAATAGGARALDLPDRGTLVPGMRADMVLWPTRDWRDITYQMGIRPGLVMWADRSETTG